MGLSNEQIDGLRMAGTIHDIGKISIPAEILSWPGKLSDIQFNLIKTHAKAGYDILKDIEFPWPIARIVLEHHERMDGSGYPNGLKRGEILLESRILSVADVVEAMASHRPYRPAIGLAAALDEIAKNRDTLYDPEVVDVCLKLFNEKGYMLVE
jgi:HD-GYP domain-containing protein (c-di-GMP phosphodiesterase class II)